MGRFSCCIKSRGVDFYSALRCSTSRDSTLGPFNRPRIAVLASMHRSGSSPNATPRTRLSRAENQGPLAERLLNIGLPEDARARLGRQTRERGAFRHASAGSSTSPASPAARDLSAAPPDAPAVPPRPRRSAPRPHRSFSNGQRAIRTQHIDQFEKNAPADCDTAIRG